MVDGGESEMLERAKVRENERAEWVVYKGKSEQWAEGDIPIERKTGRMVAVKGQGAAFSVSDRLVATSPVNPTVGDSTRSLCVSLPSAPTTTTTATTTMSNSCNKRFHRRPSPKSSLQHVM